MRPRRPSGRDTWIINGQKRWIGNAPWCDISIIWARDLADNQVKGELIVENKSTPGFSVEKIEHKDCAQGGPERPDHFEGRANPEATRLWGGNWFRDTARVLRMTRYMVGWASTGIQMGAYEATLNTPRSACNSASRSLQFQLIQVLFAKMLRRS